LIPESVYYPFNLHALGFVLCTVGKCPEDAHANDRPMFLFRQWLKLDGHEQTIV
jgi:hypothetical protein